MFFCLLGAHCAKRWILSAARQASAAVSQASATCASLAEMSKDRNMLTGIVAVLRAEVRAFENQLTQNHSHLLGVFIDLWALIEYGSLRAICFAAWKDIVSKP